MGYSINVFRLKSKGKPPSHILRTHRDSLSTEQDAVWTAKMLRRAFPKDEYGIEITREYVCGESVDFWEDEVNTNQRDLPLE